MTTKVCRRCGEEKQLEDFYNKCDRKGGDGKSSYCKECDSMISSMRKQKRLEANPELREKYNKKTREWKSVHGDKRCQSNSLKRNYGITAPQRDLILTHQGGTCAICGCIPEPPCVDHDHTTGQVRGILCHSCNMAIGLLKDNPSILTKAAAYLSGTIIPTFSKVIVLTGAPGVGKSTLATELSNLYHVVEADKHTRDRHSMYDLIEQLAKQGDKPVLVVQPFRGLTTINILESRGLTVKLAILDIPADEHLRRIQSRRPSVVELSDLVKRRRARSRVYARNRSTIFIGDEVRLKEALFTY